MKKILVGMISSVGAYGLDNYVFSFWKYASNYAQVDSLGSRYNQELEQTVHSKGCAFHVVSGLKNPIKQYLQSLPSVQVKGKTYRFLNGIGFGIDGYCCEVGDELRKIPNKKVNYTMIAIKGLLFHFDARNAKVTVDGKEYEYKKVWIAPTMHGKMYGGGMIPTPGQDRLNPDKTLSLMVFYGGGRLRTLCAFPGIFKGTHVKHKDMIAIHTGHEITVEFDRPTPLQIDGETILGVISYTAKSAICSASKVRERVYI